MNLKMEESNKDRVYRIGREYEDWNTKKTVKSIIVKFRSCEARGAFYRARRKACSKGMKKLCRLPFRVSSDLTKRRYDPLKYAKRIIKNNEKVSYAFSDVNCSAAIKDVNNMFHYFNSKTKLDEILLDL